LQNQAWGSLLMLMVLLIIIITTVSLDDRVFLIHSFNKALWTVSQGQGWCWAPDVLSTDSKHLGLASLAVSITLCYYQSHFIDGETETALVNCPRPCSW
jgi:hypothetical protein